MMRVKRLLVMFVVSVLVAVPALAPAQARVDTTADYLQRMDNDRDGRVSLDEYLAWMSYGFEAMDRDGDGTLSSAEQPGGKGKPLSRSQHHARLTDRFKRQDANRDGFLSAVELASPPQ